MSQSEEKEKQARDIRLKRLHKTCELTLERFSTVAGDTCSMTGRLRALPVSKDKRLEIVLQKKREDEALLAYMKARSALFAAIEADPEMVFQETVEVAGAPVPHRSPRLGAYRRRNSPSNR